MKETVYTDATVIALGEAYDKANEAYTAAHHAYHRMNDALAKWSNANDTHEQNAPFYEEAQQLDALLDATYYAMRAARTAINRAELETGRA